MSSPTRTCCRSSEPSIPRWSLCTAIEGLALHRPHTRIYFVVDAARAIRPETGEHLLKEWAEEGVRLVRSPEILEDGILDRYLNG
jgi:hypothetical protein